MPIVFFFGLSCDAMPCDYCALPGFIENESKKNTSFRKGSYIGSEGFEKKIKAEYGKQIAKQTETNKCRQKFPCRSIRSCNIRMISIPLS